jgi:hypothetical protein
MISPSLKGGEHARRSVAGGRHPSSSAIGPAAEHIDNLRDWLHEQGYRAISIQTMARSLAAWTDWMMTRGFGDNFLAGCEACREMLDTTTRIPDSRGPNRDSLLAARKVIG